MSMYVSSLRSSLTFPARAICLALVGCGGGDPPEETRNGRFHLDAPSATTREDFAAFGLDEGWTFWDGYAEAEPTDVDNHVQLSLDGTHLELSFPPGAEHNQWWLEHAEVTRPFEGSGIYETKMDTGIGSQQFGLVFQSAPGTFLMFMLYGHGELWGYVERFVTVDGYTHKTTFPGSATDGYNTGFSVPDAGPYHLRVTLRDAEDPSDRFWNFQWSRDGDNWAI